MDEFLKTIIRQAGTIAKEYFFRGVTYTTKSNPTDFLSEADLAVSEFLVGEINKKYPTHHIKSEELASDINSDGEYEWVIDPIDGTKNFVFGVPFWGVMIAVLKNGEPYMAAVYHPIPDELFFAEKGKGAFVNDKQIHMSNKDTLDRSTGIFSRAAQGGPYGDYFERYRSAYTRLILETNAMAANLSCAAALCYVAKGAYHFAAGNSGLDWDFLPTLFICEEAGAVVTDSDGNPWKRGRQDYVMGNKDTHPKIMELFQPTVTNS